MTNQVTSEVHWLHWILFAGVRINEGGKDKMDVALFRFFIFKTCLEMCNFASAVMQNTMLKYYIKIN